MQSLLHLSMLRNESWTRGHFLFEGKGLIFESQSHWLLIGMLLVSEIFSCLLIGLVSLLAVSLNNRKEDLCVMCCVDRSSKMSPNPAVILTLTVIFHHNSILKIEKKNGSLRRIKISKQTYSTSSISI